MSEQLLDFDDVSGLVYVLRAITNGQNTEYVLYDNRSGMNSVPSRERQLAALDYISRKKALAYTITEQSSLHRDDNGSASFIATPCIITMLDTDVFAHLQLLTDKAVNVLEQQKPVMLEYSHETGVGSANGKPFSLAAKAEKPFFDLLLTNVCQPTSKQTLARLVGISMDSPKAATIDINTHVTNLRKITGMSTYQLVQKGDFITLNATIQQNT